MCRTQRDRAIFLLMLDGGLRPGEVLGLRIPDDVEYGRRRVHIRHRDCTGKRFLCTRCDYDPALSNVDGGLAGRADVSRLAVGVSRSVGGARVGRAWGGGGCFPGGGVGARGASGSGRGRVGVGDWFWNEAADWGGGAGKSTGVGSVCVIGSGWSRRVQYNHLN